MDPAETKPKFVPRTRELDKLERLLGKAVQGQMQAAMVTGEPGAGKSSLIEEFTGRAIEANEELVVAFGLCNARTGAGDAYLPFRDILASLTAPPEPPPEPEPGAVAPTPKPKMKSKATRQILRAGPKPFLTLLQKSLASSSRPALCSASSSARWPAAQPTKPAR